MDIPEGVVALIALCMLAAGIMQWLRYRQTGISGAAALWILFEEYVAIVLILITAVAVAIQITVRYFLARYVVVSWTQDLALLALIWLSFWTAAALHRRRDHISLSLVRDLLPERAQRMMLIIADIIVFLIACLLVWYGFREAKFQTDIDSLTLGVPLATSASAVPVCFALIAIYSIVHLVNRIRSPHNPPSAPAKREEAEAL